jgi:hypothetical protein
MSLYYVILFNWTIAYLMAGAAYAHMNQTDKAEQRIEYFIKNAPPLPDYASYISPAKQLLEQVKEGKR